MMYYKPTPLFRADVREIAHELIIRTIRYAHCIDLSQTAVLCDPPCENGACVATNTCSCASGYEGETCSEIGMQPNYHHSVQR